MDILNYVIWDDNILNQSQKISKISLVVIGIGIFCFLKMDYLYLQSTHVHTYTHSDSGRACLF